MQIYTPEDNRTILQTLLPEAIIRCYDFFDERELLRLLSWADVVSIGSGLGTSDKARRILQTTLENVQVPCVVDADGLNLLAEHTRYLGKLPHENFVFTPHMKEMSRVTRRPVEELKRNRLDVLAQFTGEYRVTCVLKDARTCVCRQGEHPFVNLSATRRWQRPEAAMCWQESSQGSWPRGCPALTARVLAYTCTGLRGTRPGRRRAYTVCWQEIWQTR